MKVFLIILVCSSLVFALPTNDGLLNEQKGDVSFKVSNDADVLTSTYKKICEYCNFSYPINHELFQSCTAKDYVIRKARIVCPDQKCFDRIKNFVNSNAKELDSKKACKSLCEEEKKKLFSKFIHNDEKLEDYSNEKCDNCLNNFYILHEAFQDPLIKLNQLALNKEFSSVKKRKVGKTLIESITKEKDPKKGCEPICKI